MLELTLSMKKRLQRLHTSKHEEFENVMDEHDMYVATYPKRGSHDCEFWCNEETAERLTHLGAKSVTECLMVEGITCNFRVSQYKTMWGTINWRVCYCKK